MRSYFVGIAGSFLSLLIAAPASAAAVANYQTGFKTGAPGWSILWNANGPLGNPSNYVALTRTGSGDTTRYAGTSGPMEAGVRVTDPILGEPPLYLPGPPFPTKIPDTYVRPGQGSAEDPAQVERAIIVAYTFSAADLATAGATGQAAAFITGYDFAVSTGALPDGMSARVYHNNDPAPIPGLDFSLTAVPPFPFPAGFRFETTLDPDPIPLGVYRAGDTVYFALGANALSTGDEMRLDLTLSLEPVPEPTGLALLVPAGLSLLKRRRA